MSPRRSEREAACQQLADLEARVAEREAVLAAQNAAVSERDAEIARLRGQLAQAGVQGARGQAQLSRAVGLLLVAVGLAAGVLALRPQRPAAAVAAPAPPRSADRPGEALLADPVPAGPAVELPPDTTDPAAALDEYARARHDRRGFEGLLRAGAEMTADHPSEAIPILQEARRLRPGSAEANHFLGRALLLGGGDPAEATRYLELAASFEPHRGDYATLARIARARLSRGARAPGP